jgi:uncharacterized protein
MKKIYLIHGWDGNPQNNWFPWLKNNLEKYGCEVEAINLPNPEEPNVITWPETLQDRIISPDGNTFLIGHSIGCQTIMRYLEKLPEETKIGGVVFVAPFFKLPPKQTDDEKRIWGEWEKRPIDTNKVKNKSKFFVSIFSDDDDVIDSQANVPLLKDLLNSEIIMESGKGHFSDDDGITELPIILKVIQTKM